MATEFVVFCRQDNVGGFLAHFFFDHWHGNARQVFAKGLESLQEGLVKDAKESRDTLDIEDMNHLIDYATRQHAAEALIGDLRQRRLVLGVLEHSVEFSLLSPFLRRLQLAGALLQNGCQV